MLKSELKLEGKLRPTSARADKIKVDDVLQVGGRAESFRLLVDAVIDRVTVAGLRVIDSRLVPVKVNFRNLESWSVVREQGGLVELIMLEAENGEQFDVSTISGEQEALLRLAEWKSKHSLTEEGSLIPLRAVGLIADPVVRGRLIVAHIAGAESYRNLKDLISLIQQIGTAENIHALLAALPANFDSPFFAPLIERYLAIDAAVCIAWAFGYMREHVDPSGCVRLQTRIIAWAKVPDAVTAFESVPLPVRCELAYMVDFLRDSSFDPLLQRIGSAVEGDDLWLATFIYMRLDSTGDLAVFRDLLDAAERGVRRLKAGERPDVPWRLVFGGESVFEDITESGCDAWLQAIQSWRE